MKKLTKQQQVINFLNKHEETIITKTNQAIIALLEKELNLKHETAINYYYKWKKEFIGNSKCIPRSFNRFKSQTRVFENKELMIIDRKEDELVVKGKYNIYIKSDKGVKVGDMFFRDEEELNTYMLKEIKKFRMQCGEILDLLDEEKIKI